LADEFFELKQTVGEKTTNWFSFLHASPTLIEKKHTFRAIGILFFLSFD
jgi:hypothetical protein